jgi:hypothetical protein
MAKNTIAYYTKSGRFTTVNISHSAPITTIFTAGLEGSKILSISIIDNTFASTGTVTLYFDDGISNKLIRITDSEITANNNVMSYMDLPVNSNGDKYINIESGCTIKTDVNGGGVDNVTFCVYGEDY